MPVTSTGQVGLLANGPAQTSLVPEDESVLDLMSINWPLYGPEDNIVRQLILSITISIVCIVHGNVGTYHTVLGYHSGQFGMSLNILQYLIILGILKVILNIAKVCGTEAGSDGGCWISLGFCQSAVRLRDDWIIWMSKNNVG